MNADRAPVHVAHVIFRLAVGGLENGLVNLINGLPENRFRHSIICIDDYTDFRRRIQRDVELLAIRKRPGFDARALRRLFGVLRDLRPDVVHTRNLAALDALLPARLAGVRHCVHGEHGWDVNDLHGSNRKLLWLRRLHSPMVSHYIALSRRTGRYLTEKVGVRSTRVTEIYNGVDTSKFRPVEDPQRHRAEVSDALPENATVIGAVGRLQPVKDHLSLAKAFSLLLEARPDLRSVVRLAIVGDGETRADIERLLTEAGVRELAWLPGSREDVAKVLPCIDVFAQPSLAEGISNTVLEAMACALPVIATDVGGNAELVADNVTGTIIAPDDADALSAALEQYVDRPDLRSARGAAGRARVLQEFSLPAMIASYQAIYDGLVGDGSR